MASIIRRAEGREAFLAPFVAAGYDPVEPDILQPAAIFLDVSGEELARRLYLTTDAEGRELCLRPELTIPVCRDHVRGGDPARPGRYCYHGRAFRHREGRPGEFLQAGVERLGDADTARADAEVFALAVGCLRRHGLARPRLRLGDTGLFRAVIRALELPAAWERRLARDFGRADLVAADLAALLAPKQPPAAATSGVLRALSGADRAGARALVEDLLRIGGLPAVGGRDVAEIADRFLERAELADSGRLDRERLDLLGRMLALRDAPEAALERLEALLRPLGRPVTEAVETVARRHRALAAAGVALGDDAVFDPAFGRELDYYTGFVFEMHGPDGSGRPAVGGGRYDGLLAFLGAPGPVPAVGFSVWPERLPEAAA